MFSLVALLWGCAEDAPNEISSNQLTEGQFVYFDPQSSTTVDEAKTTVSLADGSVTRVASEVNISVLRTGTDLTEAITVQYVATVVYAESTDFADEGADASETVHFSADVITIPAGRTNGSLTITTDNDELPTGSKIISLEITGVPDPYQIGFPVKGSELNDYEVTVIEDDCPFDAAKLTGRFTVLQTRLHNGARVTYDVTVEQDANDPFLFSIDSIWDETVKFDVKLITCEKAATWDVNQAVTTFYWQTGEPIVFTRENNFFGSDPGPIFTENNIDVDPDDPNSWISYDDVKGTWTIYVWIRIQGIGSFGGHSFELTKKED